MPIVQQSIRAGARRRLPKRMNSSSTITIARSVQDPAPAVHCSLATDPEVSLQVRRTLRSAPHMSNLPRQCFAPASKLPNPHSKNP